MKNSITKELTLGLWTEGWEEDDNYDPEYLELEWKDTYPNMSGDEDNDGYHQFGGTDCNGNYFELRIPFDMIPELQPCADESQRHWDKEE